MRSVVFVHSSDELYGADRVLLDILSAVGSDCHTEVWLPDDVPHSDLPLCAELERRGVRYRHLPTPILRRAYRTPRMMPALARRAVATALLLRRTRPDVVYCTTSAALPAAPLARLAGVRTVVGHLQEHWAGSDRRVLAVFARSCRTLLAVSESVTRDLPATLRRRTTVVPNGTPEPDRVVDAHGRSGSLRAVIASRWTPRKGYDTVFAALDRLSTPWHVTVLGGPAPTGPAVDVAALAARPRANVDVEVVGPVPDIGPYLDEADLVVVASAEPESFGLIAIEAFARQRCAIATAIGGMVEVIDQDVDGWLVAPGDADALAAVMNRLDRPMVEAAGRCARARFETRFSTGAFADRWRAAVACDLGLAETARCAVTKRG